MTFCPDCGKGIPSDLFVAHREKEHPPVGVHHITVPGIKSTAAVYGQSAQEE